MADDYEVGYGKPPKHSQFQPGQSGNPKGRKKGVRGLKTDLRAVLDGLQTVNLNGKQITDRRQYLNLLMLASRGAAGEIRAHREIIPLIIQVLGVEDRGGERRQLSRNDQALLDELLADLSGDAAADLAGEGKQDDG